MHFSNPIAPPQPLFRLRTWFGQAEVHQLRAGLGQHHIARHQIAMRHPVAMSLLQPSQISIPYFSA